jgi:hypothetical protein
MLPQHLGEATDDEMPRAFFDDWLGRLAGP